jgi:MFS family permease
MTSEKPVLVRLSPFVLMVFIGYLTIGIPLAALSLYVGGTLGYGTVTVGWAVGIQAIATLLARKLAADVTDTRGTRTAVMVGLAAILVGSILHVVAANLDATRGLDLTVLMLGRIGLGIGESLMITGTLSWGIGTVGQANAGKVMTWNGIAMYLAIAIGAPLGLAIMKDYGFLGVAVVMLVLPVVSFAVVFAIKPVALHAGKRLAFYTVLGRIWGPGLGLLLATVGFAAIGTFIALDYHTRGWNGAGYAVTAFGAAYIAVRLVVGGLPDKMGGARAALISLPIEVVGMLLLWLADSPELAVLGAAISGLGFSLVFPAFGIEAVRRVPPQSRGAALAGYVAFFDGALGATGPIAGVAAAAWGYPSVFLVGAVAAAAAFGIAFRESNHRAVTETQPGIT